MRLSRSMLTALGSEYWQNETVAQLAFCVMVSGGRFLDIGAVGVLRYGLWWSIFGLSRSILTALGLEYWRNETFAQLAFCAHVGRFPAFPPKSANLQNYQQSI